MLKPADCDVRSQFSNCSTLGSSVLFCCCRFRLSKLGLRNFLFCATWINAKFICSQESKIVKLRRGKHCIPQSADPSPLPRIGLGENSCEFCFPAFELRIFACAIPGQNGQICKIRFQPLNHSISDAKIVFLPSSDRN